jgi:hypothetical protein
MTVSVDTGLKYQNDAQVRTTDATSTELLRWTPELDSASVVLLSVNGTATSGDRLASQRLYKVQRSSSGTVVTAMAAEQRHESGSAAWTVALAVDGGDGISAVVTVAGEAAHDVTWQGLADHKGRGRTIVRYWSHKCVELQVWEYINCGDNLDFDITDPFSVALWVKTSAVSSIFVKKHPGGSTGYYVGAQEQGKPYIAIQDDAGNFISRTASTGASTPNICDGTWHHLAFVYTAATQTEADLHVYIDGAEPASVATADTLTGATANAANFQIGSGSFAGRVDDPLVYDDALSGAEVVWLYSPRRPRDPADAGGPGNNVLALRCGDEDTYPTCTDYSVSGFDGTLTGTEGDEFVDDAPGL